MSAKELVNASHALRRAPVDPARVADLKRLPTGASWVRTHILNAHPHAKLTVYAIWLPILPGDSRGAWDAHVLDDPRVVSLWDGSRLAGKWIANRSLGGLGGPGNIVWDAYYAFAGNARWRGEPSGLLAAGSDIIDNTNGLEQHFLPLLTSH